MKKRRKRKKHIEPQVDLTVALGDVLRRVDRRRSKLQQLIQLRREQLATLEPSVSQSASDDCLVYKVSGKIASLESKLAELDEKIRLILSVALGDEELARTSAALIRLMKIFETDLAKEIAQSQDTTDDTIESLILQSALQNSDSEKRNLKLLKRASTHASKRLSVFEKESMRVLQKELEVNNFKPTKSAERIETLIEPLIDKLAGVRAAVSKKLSFVQRFDNNVDTAFARLLRHLDVTREAFHKSFEHEAELESSLSCAESGNRIGLDGQRTFASRAALDESRTVIKEALAALRKRNIFAADSFFYSEAVVRRLYVVKLLLSALPEGNKDESLVRSLRELINSVSNRLHSGQNADGPTSKFSDVHEQVSMLEYRIMMIYVQMAKDSEESLSRQLRVRRNSTFTNVFAELEKERIEHLAKASEWKNFHENALRENKQLLTEVASARSDYCSGMVKTIDQSISVLSIIIGKSSNAST